MTLNLKVHYVHYIGKGLWTPNNNTSMCSSSNCCHKVKNTQLFRMLF